MSAGTPGRPKGSQNKDKPYRDALRMELAAAAEKDDPFSEYRKIARAHIKLCLRGDMAAIKEFADRTDGKPAQEAEATVHHTYEKIVREIVYPEHRDSADAENKDSAGIPTAH